MRRRCQAFGLLALLFIATTASDCSSNPTGPDNPFNFDFTCASLTGIALYQCTAQVFFSDGQPLYEWAASLLEPRSGLGASTVTWDWSAFCDGGPFAVTVALAVTENEGRGQSLGPITRGFQVCSSASTIQALANGQISMGEVLKRDHPGFGPLGQYAARDGLSWSGGVRWYQ